jgi:DNA-binding NtrC family response regulator
MGERSGPGGQSLGVSLAMQRMEQLLPRVAAQADSVLILGESGAGKEKVARLLHDVGGGGSAFVGVNCAAIPETLLEAELFGCERGAFTGAARPRKGVFELAEGGTLFLDEIGDMPLTMQAKLLRALHDRRITRVGGERAIPVSTRIVCATHQDLKRMVEQGRFREDLYYRINLIQLRIPPLCERREDILWLAQQFLAERAGNADGVHKRLSPGAESALLRYDWPGNVRELRHALKHACILSQRPIIEAWDLFEESLLASDE